MKFNEKMKLHRIANGWTQTELAEKMGVKQAVISRWESETRTPTPRNVVLIAKALNVEPIYLLKEDE